MKNIVVVGEQKAFEKILLTCLDKSKLFIIARPKQIDTTNAHFIAANVTRRTIDPAMLPEVINGSSIARA